MISNLPPVCPNFGSKDDCPAAIEILVDPKKYIPEYLACVELPDFSQKPVSTVTVVTQSAVGFGTTTPTTSSGVLPGNTVGSTTTL